MSLPRTTRRSVRRSIESLEACQSESGGLPEAIQEVLSGLKELEAALGVPGGEADFEARRILGLVAAAEEAELAGQRSITAALEGLSNQLTARLELQGSGGQLEGMAHSKPAEPIERPPSLRLLESMLRDSSIRLTPELDPGTSLGHRYPFAEEKLGVDGPEAIQVLEELSDLGLFQRSLVNRIHVCRSCDDCRVNFREQCPRCDAIDLKIERVLHHFRCGHTGIESEFGSGLELACPKCRRELHQLGQDFDRPHETYVCKACEALFEEPKIAAQCLACAEVSAGHEASQRSIYAYTPTPLANRAVELGRLTGLEVDSILYDAELKIATRDFLDFEIKRELVRLGRHGTAFSTATIAFERHGRIVPIFRDWTASTLRELCILLADSLRTLDLVTRLDASRLGILMPEADELGATNVRRRLFSLLNDITFVDRTGNDLVPTWTVATWSERRQPISDVRSFLFPEGLAGDVEA